MSNIFRDEPSGQLQSQHLVDFNKDPNTVGFEKNVLKKLRKLTPRTYLGVGYTHLFRHDVSGEIVNVPCTQAEYDSLQGAGGAANNPTFAGHTWVGSCGGTYKVDTLNDRLGDDEYFVNGSEVFVNFGNTPREKRKNARMTESDLLEEKVDEEVWL